MGLTYQIVPLEDTAPRAVRSRPHAQFRSTYGQTVELLERELSHLRARDIVLAVDVERDGIRLDVFRGAVHFSRGKKNDVQQPQDSDLRHLQRLPPT